MSNRQWRLARRPTGPVSVELFTWGEGPIPEPADGEVLVRNLVLSCEPAQLGWMQGETYLPAVEIGAVMRSVAVGRVVASRNPRFAEGALVQGLFGWQDHAIGREDGALPMTLVPEGVSIESSLSALGTSGLTAYFGLLEVGRPKEGETVVVSGAAGSTGALVCQIAKRKGCRVVAIAGGAEKCRYVTEELGVDAAIDYKSENVLQRLRQSCPKGIDVYFDNVGGPTLDMVLLHLAMRGRIVLCGAISSYVDPRAMVGPKNYLKLLVKRGRMEGFIVLDHLSRAPEALRELAAWHLKDRVDVQVGLENAPAALARLFAGENQGKQLVRIAEA